MVKYLSLLLFLLGCGVYETNPTVERPDLYIHPELLTYVEDFYEAADYHGVEYTPQLKPTIVDWADEMGVKHSSPTAKIIGTCGIKEMEGDYVRSVLGIPYEKYRVSVTWSEIYILKAQNWGASSKTADGEIHPTLLRWLIFHEMGHCVLRLDHTEDRLAIMAPTLYNNIKIIEEYWPEFVAHLFNTGPSVSTIIKE